jgi:hypothetical protein
MPTGDERAATVSTATAEFQGVGGTQSRGASRFGFKSEAPLLCPAPLSSRKRSRRILGGSTGNNGRPESSPVQASAAVQIEGAFDHA